MTSVDEAFDDLDLALLNDVTNLTRIAFANEVLSLPEGFLEVVVR